MKKTLALIIALIMCLSLCACNSGSNNDFSNSIRKIDFSMTKATVKGAETLSLVSEEGLSLTYFGEVNGFPGELIYRFYEETGTIHFVRFIFDNNADFNSFVATFKEANGEPKESKNGFDFWYGKVNGIDATFSAHYSSTGSFVSVDRKTAPKADGTVTTAENNDTVNETVSTTKADKRLTMTKSEIEKVVTEEAMWAVTHRLDKNKYNLDNSEYKIGSIIKVDSFKYEVNGTLFLYNKYGTLEDVASFSCSSIALLDDGRAVSAGSVDIEY